MDAVLKWAGLVGAVWFSASIVVAIGWHLVASHYRKAGA